MIGQHLGIVHFIDVVAGEDEDILRIIPVNKIDILIDGVGRALIPLGALNLLVRGQDVDTAVVPVQIPRLTVADIIVELQRLILRQDADRVDTGIDTVGERKINNSVFSAVGDRRLGDLLRQDAKATALPPCKQHCDTLHFSRHVLYFLLLSGSAG